MFPTFNTCNAARLILPDTRMPASPASMFPREQPGQRRREERLPRWLARQCPTGGQSGKIRFDFTTLWIDEHTRQVARTAQSSRKRQRRYRLSKTRQSHFLPRRVKIGDVRQSRHLGENGKYCRRPRSDTLVNPIDCRWIISHQKLAARSQKTDVSAARLFDFTGK